MNTCSLCPRNCNVPRPGGVCGMDERALIVRAARHDWEEPCISGTRGSGTVFFAGCPLGCVFCQNYAISRNPSASPNYRAADAAELRAICLALAATGVHNINFVSPTHFTPVVRDAIGDGFGIPVVWNTGGYEKPETVRSLAGKVQIFLPDLKYLDPAPAARYSHAPDYPSVATRAILEMAEQVGECRMEDGILQQGVLIRHLLLPGQLDNTRRVIEWVDRTFPHGEVLFSLMGQYTPIPGIGQVCPELDRPVSPEEYATACQYVEDALAIQGYLQEPESSGQQYIPKWGVFEG